MYFSKDDLSTLLHSLTRLYGNPNMNMMPKNTATKVDCVGITKE